MFTIAPGTRAFGMQLPVQAQSNYFVADWERSAGPAEIARIARLCDEHGFAYVAVCDHVVIPETFAPSMGTFWVDPMSTLGWLAGLTDRVMLLTHVYVLPFRQAELAAKQFATLDWLSGGRAICGVGVGHVEAEFQRLGVDHHRRGATTTERLPVMIQALEQEFVDGMGAAPRPVQSPRPPVWVGGSSDAAVARAARFGDGWIPQGPATRELVDLLRREREHGGAVRRAVRDRPHRAVDLRRHARLGHRRGHDHRLARSDRRGRARQRTGRGQPAPGPFPFPVGRRARRPSGGVRHRRRSAASTPSEKHKV